MKIGARVPWITGSIGTGIFSTVPSILLLYFFTETLRLPILLATIAIFLPKSVSVISDPLIGRWSDRVARRRGRRPFLLAGAVASGLTLAVLFSVPRLGDVRATAAIAAIAYVAAVLGFGLFSVPYIAMPAEMIAAPAGRRGLIAQRMVMLAIGIIVGGAGGPALIGAAGGGSAGYRLMGVTLGLVVFAVMLAAALAPVPRDVSPRRGPAASASSTVAQPGYARLLALYLFAQLATGAASAALPYLVVGALGQSEGALGLLLLAMLGSGAVASLPWGWVAGRLGHSLTLSLALATGIAGMVGLGGVTLHFGIGAPFVIALILLGIGSAGVQVLAFAELSDIIERADRAGSQTSGGALTGAMTAVEKVALAGGPVVTGLIFWSFGIVQGHVGSTDVPTILLAATVAPALLLGVALLIASTGRSSIPKREEQSL